VSGPAIGTPPRSAVLKINVSATSSADAIPSSGRAHRHLRSTPRSIKPRRSLPGARAIAGGALIAVAFVGTYAAAAGAGSNDLQPVVVAARNLQPGHRIDVSDLKVVHMELTAETTDRVVRSRDAVVGSTLAGPLATGELVQKSALIAKTSSAQQVEVSFSVVASRALDGRIQQGETIDVLATDKSEQTPTARVAVTNATVVRVAGANGGSIGRSGDITITVAVNSTLEAAALTAAVDSGQITLVRTTGTATAS
jgi:Flp pilus assembly protein CpaB